MRLLIVNLHSSENAGDHALTVESLQQLRAAFPGSILACAYNDPASAEPDIEAIPSFFTWLRRRDSTGQLRWNMKTGPWLLLAALMIGVVYRFTRRLPRLWLTNDQYRLVRIYATADAVISCAGNVFYSSGSGVNYLLNIFTFVYGALLGKPLYSLPQSFGPLRQPWERWVLGWMGRRVRLLLAREPISARLLVSVGVPESRFRLVPDMAFAYEERDDTTASAKLNPLLQTDAPIVGFTMINWGAQNRRFGGQSQYEEAIAATIRRFLAETDGQVVLFAQVWGPTELEDDRIPARRVAALFADTNRVHFLDDTLPPPVLKGCFKRLDLLVGTRLHSNIFALSVGTPVVAIGYFTKTAGIMEMAGMSEWMLLIENATTATLPDLVLRAWEQREELTRQVAEVIPALIEQSAHAALLLRQDMVSHD